MLYYVFMKMVVERFHLSC